jgi:hypothetical protein
MNTRCDSVERLSLGAYVLGTLDPVERAEVDAHVSQCAACREELAELAGMPGLLARVRLEDLLEPLPPVPRASLARLIERLRNARRARRRRMGVAASAIAIVALTVGAVVVGTRDTGGTGPPSEVASVSATNPRTGVAARIGLRPATWGTAIRVRLRGVPPGTRCRLIAFSRSGRREVAGTWRATYEGTADVQTATAIPKNELASLAVVTAGGRSLVRTAL